MSFERRQYSGNAPAATLAGPIDNVTGSIACLDLTNWPDGAVGPFGVTLDRGKATEEKIKATARSGNTLTGCLRGQEGTAASPHQVLIGGVEHTIFKQDLDEANQHYADPTVDHHTQYAKAAVAADLTLFVSAAGNDANDGFSLGRAKRTLQAAHDLIPVNGGGLIKLGGGAFAGATLTDRRIHIEGVGEETILGALVWNATAHSVVSSGLRNLQVVGAGSGTGITYNMTSPKEYTFVSYENVLVNGWAKDIDVTSGAFDGVFYNVALEFATTGATLRGRIIFIKPWFESVTTGLDVQAGYVELYSPKWSGGVTTKMTVAAGAFVNELNTEQGRHNLTGNVAVGYPMPDPTNQFSDGVGGMLGIANATTPPSGSPAAGGLFYVQGGVVKYKGSGGGGARVTGNSRFGPGADGAAGAYVGAGQFDPTHALLNADGATADIGMLIRSKGAGVVNLQNEGGSRTMLQADPADPASGAAAISIVYHNGTAVTFQRLTVGSADSGGAGYRLLRVPN